jgi:hypothetical protein
MTLQTHYQRWLTLLLLAIIVGLSGCQFVGSAKIETPQDRIAAAQLTLKTVYDTAAAHKARGSLSVADERQILLDGATVQSAIDEARAIVSKGGSPAQVDAVLKLLEARLLALEASRTRAGVQ